MELCHLKVQRVGCNNEVTALQSDCITEVPLYLKSVLSAVEESLVVTDNLY